MLPRLAFVSLVALLATAADAQPAPAPPAEVSIPNSRRVEFVSTVNGHRYLINVALPNVPPPTAGYRVLYVLDGNGYFGMASDAVRMNGNAPDVVVVGIGYPDSPEFVAQSLAERGPVPERMAALRPVDVARRRERPYDLTLPATAEQIAAQTVPGIPPYLPKNVGGLDDFLKMIERDVKPRIAAMVPIDLTQQALFGHSLGGLAVLHALFTEPSAFRTFIIASPSIWWNERAVLAGEAKFAAAVKSGKATPRILVTIGADESTPPDNFPPGTDVAAWLTRSRKIDMVGNGRALTERLQALKGAPGYKVADYATFAHQSHGISAWPAMGRAIEFAFGR